jgi:hypothetical protein
MKRIGASINLDLRLVSVMLQLVPQPKKKNLFGRDRNVYVKLTQKQLESDYQRNKYMKRERKKKEKLYEGMGICFQVISNIILSFCAFSTWKMPFPSWTGHQQVNCSHVKR